MAEAVSYTSSSRFYDKNSQRLKQFRNTIIQRNKILKNRKERYLKQFYISRNLPIPEDVLESEDYEEDDEELENSSNTKIPPSTSCSPGPIRWGYKNVYAASISFMLVFSAFVGLQNLQSSLNRLLGTTSLALIYIFFLLVGFVTPGVVRLLGTKNSLLFGYVCHLIYILTNYYPSFFTLVPSSVILGIGSGPLWAGLSTHLASIAVIVAPYIVEDFDALISKFTGLFFFIFQLTQILGNLVSSLVLFPYNERNSSSLIVEQLQDNQTAIEICDNSEAQSVSNTQSYILISIYVSFDLLGIALLVVVVDRLPKDASLEKMQSKLKSYCGEPFVDLLKVLFSRNMLLLGPLSLYNGMELSFAYSSYTQVHNAQ